MDFCPRYSKYIRFGIQMIFQIELSMFCFRFHRNGILHYAIGDFKIKISRLTVYNIKIMIDGME